MLRHAAETGLFITPCKFVIQQLATVLANLEFEGIDFGKRGFCVTKFIFSIDILLQFQGDVIYSLFHKIDKTFCCESSLVVGCVDGNRNVVTGLNIGHQGHEAQIALVLREDRRRCPRHTDFVCCIGHITPLAILGAEGERTVYITGVAIGVSNSKLNAFERLPLECTTGCIDIEAKHRKHVTEIELARTIGNGCTILIVGNQATALVVEGLLCGNISKEFVVVSTLVRRVVGVVCTPCLVAIGYISAEIGLSRLVENGILKNLVTCSTLTEHTD